MKLKRDHDTGIKLSVFSCSVAGLALSACADAGLSSEIDDTFHIQPLLLDRCLKSHDPDANQRQAELQLGKSFPDSRNSRCQRMVVTARSNHSYRP